MTDFRFNSEKSFEANLTAFLQHITAEDAELGAILAAHISLLKEVDERARPTARREFNAAVKSSLDNLIVQTGGGGGE